MLKKSNFLLIALLIIFIIPSLFGLFHAGFPVTDDGSWMIIRFASFFAAIRHGQFPVRYLLSLNHGYGYPVADFLYPLFMYIGVGIHVAGFGFSNTIKIILGLSLFFSGICSFLWLRKLFSRLAAFVGALCYVFFPYHLYDIYQRGSVGEVIALAVVPFILWQIERKSFIFVSLGIACLILAHNTLSLLFLPIIILYMCLSLRIFGEKLKSPLFRKDILPEKRETQHMQTTKNVNFSPLSISMSVMLGLGISAFFWLPALYDKQFTVFDSIRVSDYTQYFLTSKNFGIFGIFSLMVSILGVGYIFKNMRKNDLFFLAVIYIGLFFSLPVSSFLWHVLPLPQLVQFPFRFLSISMLGTAFVIAFILDRMKTSIKFLVALICIILLYISAWNYLYPKSYEPFPDSYYATNQDTTTVKNEYMPKWVKQVPLSSSQNTVEVIKGKAVITNVSSNGSNKIQFSAHVSQSSTVRLNIAYFPGWNIFVNNKLYPFSYTNPQGVIEISLPPGEYIVTARFGETQVRAISDGIFILSLVVLIIVAVLPPLKKRLG